MTRKYLINEEELEQINRWLDMLTTTSAVDDAVIQDIVALQYSIESREYIIPKGETNSGSDQKAHTLDTVPENTKTWYLYIFHYNQKTYHPGGKVSGRPHAIEIFRDAPIIGSSELGRVMEKVIGRIKESYTEDELNHSEFTFNYYECTYSAEAPTLEEFREMIRLAEGRFS